MSRHFSATRHGIPLLALVMISFAGWSIAAKHTSRIAATPPIAAPTNPYDENVAGTGIVEPASEVIALAIERGGIVTGIEVVAGDRVKARRALFSIDDRDYRAAVVQNDAAVAVANASIATIDQSLILQRDKIDQARADLESAEAERNRADRGYFGPAQGGGGKARPSESGTRTGEGRSRQDRGQGTDRRGDPQGQCSARRIRAGRRPIQSANDHGLDRSAACSGGY